MSLTTVDATPTMTAFTATSVSDDGAVDISVLTLTTVSGHIVEVPVTVHLGMDGEFSLDSAPYLAALEAAYLALGYALP